MGCLRKRTRTHLLGRKNDRVQLTDKQAPLPSPAPSPVPGFTHCSLLLSFGSLYIWLKSVWLKEWSNVFRFTALLTFVAEFCFVMSRLKIQVSEAKSRQKKKKTEKKARKQHHDSENFYVFIILKRSNYIYLIWETVVNTRSENATHAVVNEPVYSVIYIMQSVLKT